MAKDGRKGRTSAGRRPSSPVSPEMMVRAVGDVMSKPWIEVATLATLLKVGLPTAYREAREGRFGAFRVGAQFRIPSAGVRSVLGLTAAPIPVAHPAEAAPQAA